MFIISIIGFLSRINLVFRTKNFTPIFNTPNFKALLSDGGGVDGTNHLRILETFLFPKREIILIEEIGEVVSIQTKDYPWDAQLFTKATFLEKGVEKPFSAIPPIPLIINRLRNFPKIPYLLGGTIPKSTYMGLLLEGNEFKDRHKVLFGIDCSGLLYYVTEGNLPRNTSDLLKVGMEVQELIPLDLILFKGHVLIYLGEGEVIESREKDGVVISCWEERKKEITKAYTFIRFHPGASSQIFSPSGTCGYQNPMKVC